MFSREFCVISKNTFSYRTPPMDTSDLKPFKMMKNAFYLTLKKALFVFKMFKFLSGLFGHIKNDLIRNLYLVSNFMTSNLFNKQLQYTYCPIFHKVKGTRQ